MADETIEISSWSAKIYSEVFKVSGTLPLPDGVLMRSVPVSFGGTQVHLTFLVQPMGEHHDSFIPKFSTWHYELGLGTAP